MGREKDVRRSDTTLVRASIAVPTQVLRTDLPPEGRREPCSLLQGTCVNDRLGTRKQGWENLALSLILNLLSSQLGCEVQQSSFRKKSFLPEETERKYEKIGRKLVTIFHT